MASYQISDAFETSVPDFDVPGWERENQYHILDWVDSYSGLNDIWVNPNTGEPADRCPWLRKLPKKDRYIYGIHGIKPDHCRTFPKSKRHAFLTKTAKDFPQNKRLTMPACLIHKYREAVFDNPLWIPDRKELAEVVKVNTIMNKLPGDI